jgi:hypothetical protein
MTMTYLNSLGIPEVRMRFIIDVIVGSKVLICLLRSHVGIGFFKRAKDHSTYLTLYGKRKG